MEGFEPAQLAFLTIYNPTLSIGEENTHEQILYYYSSRNGHARRTRERAELSSEASQNEEKNERMRQVGLAQGIVNLARDLAGDQSLRFINTEKAATFTHELEENWWLLASVDLTRIESDSPPEKSESGKEKSTRKIDFTSRELSPQWLHLQQVLRAHGIFLLHHGPSLSDILAKRGRHVLSTNLERFWNRFIRHWDVLMHGLPAIDVYDGLKLAAGGELGMGVGEEDWGSGERAVLEDLVSRTDGLLDLVVSRFGDPPSGALQPSNHLQTSWLGTGAYPEVSDGVIMSGVGSVPRIDIIRISAWLEWVYRFGISAYGIQDNPQSSRRKRHYKQRATSRHATNQETRTGEAIDTREHETSSRKAVPPLLPPGSGSDETGPERGGQDGASGILDTDTLFKYMTLGIYGSSWGIQSGRPSPNHTPSAARTPSTASRRGAAAQSKDLVGDSTSPSRDSRTDPSAKEQTGQQHPDTTGGCYLVGLQGDLHEVTDADVGETGTGESTATSIEAGAAAAESVIQPEHAARRIHLRTIHVTHGATVELPMLLSTSRLRVIIYARQPFLYAFLFDANAQPGLAFPSFYRNLHNELAPLHKPLLKSTSPVGVRQRLLDAASGPTFQEAMSHPTSPVYDLVYDPASGTCHSSLPSIPGVVESLGLASHGRRVASTSITRHTTVPVGPGSSSSLSPSPWTRSDAIAVYNIMLRIWEGTRHRSDELERTVRTSRGWWIVWMRLPANMTVLESADAANKAAKNERTRHEEEDAIVKQDIMGAEHSEKGSNETAQEASTQRNERDRPSLSAESAASVASANKSRPQPIGMMREAFLVRKMPKKATTSGAGATASTRGFFAGLGMGMGMGVGLGSGTSPIRKDDKGGGAGGFGGGSGAVSGTGDRDDARPGDGIGFDTRRYIEGLLSLNR